MVFDNKTLDDIVAKMPTSQGELLKCNGIGQKRLKRFGVPILQTIELYKLANQEEQTAEVDHGDDDKGIIPGPVLSVEEIVRGRIKEAERRGEVFEVL